MDNSYDKKINVIRNFIKYLDLERLLDSDSLDDVINILRKSLASVRMPDMRTYFIQEDKELYKNLYKLIYRVVKEELAREVINSKLLEDIMQNKDDILEINSLLVSEIEELLNSKKLSNEDYKMLSFNYNDFLDGNDLLSKKILLSVAYLQNKEKVKVALEKHYEKTLNTMKVNTDFLDKHYDGANEDVTYYNEIVKGINKNTKKFNFGITKRIAALALSLGVLTGGIVYSFKGIKYLTTNTTYKTTIDRITFVEDGEIVDRFHNEYNGVKRPEEELYIYSDYSKIFYDKDGAFRYENAYILPYVLGTPLEDYIDLDVKELEPLVNKSGRFSAKNRPSIDNDVMRDITVYSQDLENPYIEEDLGVRYFLDALILIIFGIIGIVSPYFPIDDIETIIDLLNKKKKNKEDIEEIMTYLDELLKELERVNINLEEARILYYKMRDISLSLGLNVPIDTSKHKDYYTLKLKKTREITW